MSEPVRLPTSKRDYYAGALMIVIGLITANEGRGYTIGSLHQMGPGYFPVALGLLLTFLGILIAGTASTGGDGHQEAAALPHAEWRGWLGILGGPIAFMIVGERAGMALATFACVFIAALGDRQSTWKSAALLALCVTIFGVVLFSYLLKIPMPVFKWGT